MSDLRTELRNATAASHVAIESNPRLARLLSPSLSRDEYLSILKRYYGFFKPIEALLPSSYIAKTPALVADIGDVSSLPVTSELPPVGSLGALFGVMYVLEGSAMGGVQIARHLANFPFTDGHRSFFVADGAAVSSRWKEFAARLADVPASEWPDARAAAVRTFELLDQWMRG